MFNIYIDSDNVEFEQKNEAIEYKRADGQIESHAVITCLA